MTKVTKASLEPPKIKWLVEPTYDDDGVQRSAGLDEFGREHPDPVPHSISIGVSPGVDRLHETLRRMVADELFRQAVDREEFESFEESEDFDVEDDMFPVDPHTPWEAVFDPPAGGVAGNGATLASGAVKGENRAPEEATRPPASSNQVPEPNVKRSESDVPRNS